MGKKSVTYKNKKQETRNKKQETRNKKQETRNKKQETRNKNKKVAQNYRGGYNSYATVTDVSEPEDSEATDFLKLKEGLLSIGLGMVVVGLSVYLAK